MLSASSRTLGAVACVVAIAAISIAWAWWGIIRWAKAMSASLWPAWSAGWLLAGDGTVGAWLVGDVAWGEPQPAASIKAAAAIVAHREMCMEN
jgi:hypothetical protein